MYKRVSTAKLAALRAILDVTIRQASEPGLDLGDEADTAGEPEDIIDSVRGDLVLSSRAEGFR
jgi:hypothetical protein